uniref:Dipeptidase 2 n=1 Tax=Talaromyces marneffei PM1 TaxID=1077442 RepID=A0A093Y6U3_TALMA
MPIMNHSKARAVESTVDPGTVYCLLMVTAAIYAHVPVEVHAADRHVGKVELIGIVRGNLTVTMKQIQTIQQHDRLNQTQPRTLLAAGRCRIDGAVHSLPDYRRCCSERDSAA